MKLYSAAALVVGMLFVSAGVFAQGKSQSVNARQFAVIMDGPITINEQGLQADLYSVNGGVRIGKTVRGGFSCGNFEPPLPVPILPPCEMPPSLQPGQFYYEDHEVVFELPGGTIQGFLKGYEVFNSNPPVNGGDRSAAAVEEGVVTGGTGKYANAQGEFFSRISDEFKIVEIFGMQVEAPYWFHNSVVVFQLR